MRFAPAGSSGNVFTGMPAVHDHFAQTFTMLKNLKVTIPDIKAESDGTLAFAYSTQHLTGTMNSHPLDIVLRQTDCYHRVHGKWLVINQNLSVPFDPQTGKTVFDSK